MTEYASRQEAAVAVIGLGQMGTRLAEAFLTAGHRAKSSLATSSMKATSVGLILRPA